MAKKKEVMMEGAPYWYGTHLNKLDFEWSPEEEIEIERYCERILKNIEEEGEMTPLERWNAQMHGKPGDMKNADRKLLGAMPGGVTPTRTLDCYADALKPIDIYRRPKLYVKALLATVARFKTDWPMWANISYTEDLWGARAKMIDYGNPGTVGEMPIKTMKDLEALKGYVPDPYSAGLYPGWLWSNREMRQILDKYKVPMPLWSSMCPGASEVAQLGMMGWTPFQVALIKNPELARACCDLAHKWNQAFGRALIDVGHPNAIYCCQFTGGFPMKGNEWVADLWKELGENLKAYSLQKSKHKVPGKPDGILHLCHGYSFLSGVFQWYDIGYERGSFRPDMWDGGFDGYEPQTDMKRVWQWHKDHNMFLIYTILNETLEKGPISKIEEACKELSEFGMSHRKFSPGVRPVYFCPQAHTDAAIEAMRKYNKL